MTVGNYTEIVHLIPYHPILNVLHNILRLLYQQNYFVLYIIFVDVACRTPVHAFRHRHLKLGSSLLLTFHFFPLTCTCNDEAVLGYLIITTNLGIPSPYKSSSWQQTVTKQWFIILNFFLLSTNLFSFSWLLINSRINVYIGKHACTYFLVQQ